MPRTREQILDDRRKLKVEYGELFDDVSALLFRRDPIGIAFDNENADEYDPEAGGTPRQPLCHDGLASSSFLRTFFSLTPKSRHDKNTFPAHATFVALL